MTRSILVSMIAAAFYGAAAHATVVSNFETDSEGWEVVSFTDFSRNDYTEKGRYAVNHILGGGHPGNYIAATDPDNGDFTFSAPAAFLGNQAAVRTLSYDLTYRDGSVNWQTTDLMLVGGGQRLLWRRDPAIVPNSGWTRVSVNFAPSSEWRVATTDGAFATIGDFSTVLSNLSGLYIHAEYTDGIVETAGLDNVRLGAVPLPGAATLFGFGLLGLNILSSRRRAAA
ncbi:laminin B domain-containing protein [Methylomonas sp. MS20]|uniref:laminin B domain-containing protein n=1 Tax=Methylomonas sp. MS20 TaxID=3418769 RepID=UPI003D010F4F